MSRRFSLTIADVCLSLSCDDDVEIEETDPSYAQFLGPPLNPADLVEFDFRLRFDSPPDLDGLPVVFDTGEAWKVLQDGDDRLLTLPVSMGHCGHLWVVRLAGGGARNEVHCGEALLRGGKDRSIVFDPLRYPLDQILMMHLAAGLRYLIVHSAGFCRGGVGALFAGVSGAGKSTLTGLLSGLTDTVHLSDDRVVVRRTHDGIRLYGTPWPGEAGVAANESAPLGAVVLLSQAAHHGLRQLDPAEALKRLLPMMSVLWYDPFCADAGLAWCDELMRSVPAYELAFAKDEGVADVVGELFDELGRS